MLNLRRLALVLALCVSCGRRSGNVQAFQPQQRPSNARSTQTTASIQPLYMADENKPEYSRELYLREEAESPFRKVRFFFYYSLAGGALSSSAISLARVAAALNGINTELFQESATNVAVDVGGLIVLGFLYKQDLNAQNSRLKRASKGAELAKLVVRCSKQLVQDLELPNVDTSAATFQTSLASLRRGRGIEKRVVITAASADKIQKVLDEAKALQDSLSMSDLLIVPVVYPEGRAPEVSNLDDLPSCVALPAGNNWKLVIDDEAEEAIKQEVDIAQDGFCVILKKNGRVGQRTKGIFLDRMVGEVAQRAEYGLDVKNI